MYYKNVFFLFFVSVLSFSFVIQTEKEDKKGIQWMTWEEMQIAQKNQPRKVFIDVYTSWCSWCKRLDVTTFKDSEIIEYINANYYSVKFDAESRETITFKGEKYKYTREGKRGSNELARILLKGNMSYPTTVYLDEKLEILTVVGGYLEKEELNPILQFFATDSFLKMKWSQYQELNSK